jgi:hypothetical protein
VACLEASGALVPINEDDELSTESLDIEALEREHEAWLATQTQPLGLTDAVLADREE